MATPEDGLRAAQEATESLLKALHDEGITLSYLAKKLKSELNAKENKVFCNESTRGQVVFSPKMIAWDIRQKARIDAHKLLDHYPSERIEHSGKGGAPISIEITQFGNNGNGKDHTAL